MRSILPLATLVLAATVAPTAASADEVTATPTGEYLMRFRHLEGNDFAPGGVANFVRHRARLGLRLDYDESIATFIQLQDVRIWGEESDTLGDYSADGLDAHQAFLELTFDRDARLRVGRQEIGYLNHRLIGTSSFDEQGRSFDAVRLMVMAMDRELALDFFYARTAHALLPPNETASDDVFAAAAKLQLDDHFQASLISVLDLGSGIDRVRSTTGLILTTDWPWLALKASVEGYVQVGSSAPDLDILAWMAAARVRYAYVDADFQPFVEVFVELSSGDSNPGDREVHTFDTLFASRHKFHGEADLFANLPVDTAQRGLADLGGALGFDLERTLGFTLAVHGFRAMNPQGGPGLYAFELDNTLSIEADEHLSFDLNYSLTIPGEGLTAAAEPLAEHLFYLTTAARF